MSDAAIRIIAENRIQEAMDEGLFDSLPRRGRIDCGLRGEAFLRDWFSKRLNAHSSEPVPGEPVAEPPT